MTATTKIVVTASGWTITLSVEEARELRDFLIANGEVTPLPKAKK